MGWEYPYFGWNDELELVINPGPNQGNDLKLALMYCHKKYGNNYHLSVKKDRFRDYANGGWVTKDVIIGKPRASYAAKLEREKAEAEEHWQKRVEEAREESYYRSWKRVGKRKRPKGPRKHPGWGPQDLNEEEKLELELSKPRCRYQRGWKRIYLSTRQRWGRSGKRNWKRYGKRRKAWQKDVL